MHKLRIQWLESIYLTCVILYKWSSWFLHHTWYHDINNDKYALGLWINAFPLYILLFPSLLTPLFLCSWEFSSLFSLTGLRISGCICLEKLCTRLPLFLSSHQINFNWGCKIDSCIPSSALFRLQAGSVTLKLC